MCKEEEARRGATDGEDKLMERALSDGTSGVAAGGRIGRRGPGVGVGVWVLAIGLLDFSLEQAIVVPALPAIQHRYQTTPTAVTWILTGFLLSAAVSTPLAGRLGDRHGKRLVLIASLALFLVGSVICAVGDSIGVVIAGRVVQGLGAGVGPLAVALVGDHLPRDRIGHGVGLLVGLAGAGGVVGFLACGLLVEYVSVPAIFWFTAALAAACIVSVWLTVRETPLRASAGVDWWGAVLLGAGLAALLLAISEGNDWHWDSARVLWIFAGAVVLLAAFAVRERTASAPLIDPRALARRAILSSNIAVFGVGYALLVGYALVPLIAGLPKVTGYGLGLSTIQLSLALAPSAVGALLGGLVSARVVSRLGARQGAAIGALCGLGAYVAFVGFSWTVLAILLIMVPVGFGTGLSISATTDLAVLAANPDEKGITVALNGMVRAVGSALGAQVAVAIYIAAPKLPLGIPEKSGVSNAFIMALVATAIAATAVMSIPRRSADPTLVGLAPEPAAVVPDAHAIAGS